MDEIEQVWQTEQVPAAQTEPPEPLDPKTLRRQFSRIGWGYTLMVVLYLAGAAVFMMLARAWRPSLLENDWFLMSVNFLPLYLLGLPALLLVLRKLPNLPTPEKKHVRPGTLLLIGLSCFAVSYGFNMFSQLLMGVVEKIKGGEVLNPLESLITGSGSPWPLLFYAVLLAPVFEEFAFRRLLYRKLAAFGPKTYLLLSSLIFALYHVNFYQMFYAFAIGLILAGLTYYTGNIRASTLLHLTINLIGTGGPLLALHYGGEAAVYVLSGAVLVLFVAGLLSGIALLAQRGRLHLAGAACRPPESSAVFGNTGMPVLLVVLSGITTYMLIV